MTLTADRVQPGQPGTDAIYADDELHWLPSWIPSTANSVHFRSSQVYWYVRSGFGRDVADRMVSGDLRQREVAELTEWIEWIARAREGGIDE